MRNLLFSIGQEGLPSSLQFANYDVRLICVILFFLSVVACSQPLYWAKPGAQSGDFERDTTECRRTIASEGSQGMMSPTQLNPAIGISQSAVEECLGTKGWFLAEKPDL